MFSDEYTGFVVLRDGSFVTDKYAYKNNTFYDRITGEIVDLPKKLKPSLNVPKMNYECLTKLLKAIYYASQKVIRLKLVKYKLKLKKQKNNLYEKGATYYSCSFYFLITHQIFILRLFLKLHPQKYYHHLYLKSLHIDAISIQRA